MTPSVEASRRMTGEHGWSIIGDFRELLRLPNVTGSVADLDVNAEEIMRRFAARGATMEVLRLDDASPVVVGELRTDKPTATIGVYVHYDGQPTDPSAWAHPPFSATLLDGPLHEGGRPVTRLGGPIDPEWRIYARGASDDKTPLAAIVAALDALEGAGIGRTVDLVFLFEGEEESGSPNLGRYLETFAERLQADAWLLCDGPVHQSRAPQVSFGARGYSGFDLTFYGPERELHSGHYGNWVPNPAFELARFLATCKDDRGNVTIPDFYRDTRPLTEADRAAIEALPPVEDRLQTELGFAGPEPTESGYAEQLMLPSFNIRGLKSAGVLKDARNVIPSEATVSVDIRLAAGDEPEAMIERFASHLRHAGYHIVTESPTAEERRTHRFLARLIPTPGYRAVRIPLDSPFAEILLDVCREASDVEPVALPTFGGSIPLYLFEEILQAPVAVLPIANHDNNQHAPNENIRIANLWYGIDLWAVLLTSDFSALATGG